jgi:hypothetical protein
MIPSPRVPKKALKKKAKTGPKTAPKRLLARVFRGGKRHFAGREGKTYDVASPDPAIRTDKPDWTSVVPLWPP